MKPYALLSDQHAHTWSAYSTTLAGGMNSRLQIILDEMRRAAEELRAAGGKTLVFAGDLFHTRGSLDPEVLNPVSDLIKSLIWDGFEIVAIPGNHDNKSDFTTKLGNAIQSLMDVNGFHVITEPQTMELDGHRLLLMPWFPKIAGLKTELEEQMQGLTPAEASATDVIMHAGIDGVLSGMPSHGLTPAYLAGLGFKRVFSGHYHHSCSFEDGKVWSIGATTHQTWSDIGTRAGFLLVHEDRVDYRASRAPSFVEVSDETDEDDIPMIVPGNYVRVRGFKFDDAQVKAFRKELERLGAVGTTFHTERTTVTARTGATSAKGVSLEDSVGGYIKRLASPHEAAILARTNQIISEVRATTE